MSIIRGSTLVGPIVESGYSPSKGYYTRNVYRGTKAQVEALIPSFVASGYEYSLVPGSTYTLTVNLPTDVNNTESPQPTWELHANVVDKDLLDADSSYIKTLHPSHVIQLKKAFKNPPVSGASPFLAVTGVTSAQLRAAYTVWNLHLLGIKSVPVNMPILKRQMTVSNVYIIQNTTSNVDRIFSTNSLVGQEQVPVQIQGCIPYPTTSEVTSPISSLIKLHYGWRKIYPVIARTAEVKYQVSQEWHYGLWAESLWGDLL